MASWEAIAACVRAVEIPVVLNGNIRVRADAEAAMAATGCVGVMSGCGLLRDAYLFERPMGGVGGGGGKRVEMGDAGGGDVGRGLGGGMGGGAVAGSVLALGFEERRTMALEYLAERDVRNMKGSDGVAKHLKEMLGGSLAPKDTEDPAAWTKFRTLVTRHRGGSTGEIRAALRGLTRTEVWG